MVVARPHHVPISKVVIGEEEIAAVAAVLRSGNLREGPHCKAFEAEFARSVGAQHALTTSSGTAALQMAYEAVLQPGDEVLVPAFTFFATASMVVAVGGVPVFCDIDPDTLTIDLEDAGRRVTAKTRAIAPVHIFGNPVDVAAMQSFAGSYQLAIVWDAAQAHGTRWQGQDIGSLDDAVCYSFYPSKNMTTGEGGMVCTNDDGLAARLRLLRSQGQSRKYWHTALGYNFRMTDFQAVIGRGQLRQLPDWVRRRRENAAYLRERLAATDLVRVQTEQPAGEHAYHQFSILVDERVDRDALLNQLREAGVEGAVHYPTPLHRQPFFAAGGEVSLPVSEATSQRIMSLPVHPYLSSDDLAYVAEQVLVAV